MRALQAASRVSKAVANLSKMNYQVTASTLKYGEQEYNYQQNKERFNRAESFSGKGYAKAGLIGSAAAASFGLWYHYGKEEVFAEAVQRSDWIPTKFRKDLPTFRRSEVEKHKTKANGIWVTYRGAVYDVTKFIKDHPGGPSRIKLAAGGPLEPFWHLYQMHQTDDVLAMAEKHRIGNLDERDIDVKQEFMEDDAYKNEPLRHPAMIPNSLKPWCGEAPGSMLADKFYTPNELHYVRNHHPVPKVDIKNYKMGVSVDGKPGGKEFTVTDLQKKFEPLEVSCTLQCAGNRRTSFNPIRMTAFAQYENYAISCAKWKGARLRDVLLAAGLPEDYHKLGIEWIVFTALDVAPENKTPFTISVPIQKAMDPNGDCILAYEMNGEVLPPDHGYPIRALNPGFVGLRNCKWVGKVHASKTKDDGPWKNIYKVTPPRPEIESFDFKELPEIFIWPVQSVIANPVNGTTIDKDTEDITATGFAWSGMGRGINRVDVSTDGGETWEQADLDTVDQPMFKKWAWTRWDATIPVPKDVRPGGSFEVRCKAVDDAYNSQPSNIREIWNLRGCFNNSQHRVSVNMEA